MGFLQLLSRYKMLLCSNLVKGVELIMVNEQDLPMKISLVDISSANIYLQHHQTKMLVVDFFLRILDYEE